MKLIDRKNFLPILGVTYMCIIICSTIIEIISTKQISPQHVNNLMILIFTAIAIAILSQHYRFDSFSPLVTIILQYFTAITLVLLIVWIVSFIEPVAEGGYKDIFISFTIPYIIGALVYYINLKIETSKQNKDLQLIKSLSQDRK